MVWSAGPLHWSGLVDFFWSRLVQGAIYWSLVVKSSGLYGGLWWSGGIVAYTLKQGFVGLWYSGLVWWRSLVWSWVDLVCCSYGGLHWCGWGDNVGLEWSGWRVYGDVQWSWALVLGFFNTLPFKVFSATTSRLCLTSQMKVSFYEARDVPAVWLCFHPHSLLNVSRQSCQNPYGRTEGGRFSLIKHGRQHGSTESGLAQDGLFHICLLLKVVGLTVMWPLMCAIMLRTNNLFALPADLVLVAFAAVLGLPHQ